MGRNLETTLICPKCGESNSNDFRFCGMCGTPLDASRSTGAAPSSAAAAATSLSSTTPARITTVSELPRANSGIAATSLFDQPAGTPQTVSLPSVDLLREQSFSGLDSFLEPERPKSSPGRIIMLIVLLAALGIAGWWTYSNYLGATETHASQAAPSTATQPSADSPTQSSIKDAAPADVPAAQPAQSSSTPSSGTTTPASPVPAIAKKPVEPKLSIQQPKPQKPATAVSVNRAVPANPAAEDSDTGDALFRKGEASLYGRGGSAENCDEAIKNLKAASAKSNAKARSAFGTMYATGHCVPRDLPTSYQWFALALRVDPNNQILEKDLSAIWNQMTPPERQSAMRSQQ